MHHHALPGLGLLGRFRRARSIGPTKVEPTIVKLPLHPEPAKRPRDSVELPNSRTHAPAAQPTASGVEMTHAERRRSHRQPRHLCFRLDALRGDATSFASAARPDREGQLEPPGPRVKNFGDPAPRLDGKAEDIKTLSEYREHYGPSPDARCPKNGENPDNMVDPRPRPWYFLQGTRASSSSITATITVTVATPVSVVTIISTIIPTIIARHSHQQLERSQNAPQARPHR